jgi:hypothetical protein
MSHRNINSILLDNEEGLYVVNSAKNPMQKMSTPPEIGEEVFVESSFIDSLLVEVQTVINDGNTYQGIAKQELWEGILDEAKQHVGIGDLVEFSRSKIHGIRRS